jgi:Kef-type K+ transport system membrane component KefB
MQILVVVPVILIAAFLLGEIFKKIGLPAVTGQIVAGVILGLPFMKNFLFNEASSLTIIDFLADLGIVFLLFLAGLEIDIDKIKRTSRDSVLISFSSALFPFFLGFIFILTVFPQYGFFAALVFGGALMVTSEGTTVKVLMDLNSLNTRLGAVMLAAGAIDDIFEVLFLSVLVVMTKGGDLLELAKIPLELIIFAAVAFFAFRIICEVFSHIESNGGDETELFSLVIIFILVLAALSDLLQIGYLIGAIIGGFLLQFSMRTIRRDRKRDIIKVTNLVTLGFIVPFFFVNVGLNFDANTLFTSSTLLAITVIIAFLGKIVGTIIVKPFSNLNLKQLYYTGWAMNSRGAAELVIALTAFRYGLIPIEIFSALVAMSLITTLVFPAVLARGISENPGLMNSYRKNDARSRKNTQERIKADE